MEQNDHASRVPRTFVGSIDEDYWGKSVARTSRARVVDDPLKLRRSIGTDGDFASQVDQSDGAALREQALGLSKHDEKRIRTFPLAKPIPFRRGNVEISPLDKGW